MRTRPEQRAARLLNTASAILAAGVATDSSAEHYRAGFHNPAMFVAPVVSSIGLTTAVRAAVRPDVGTFARRTVFGLAVMTGVAGLVFHIRNISKRPGGVNSTSLFFGAPVAAPLGVTMAGLLGLAASRVAASSSHLEPRTIAGLSAIGLIGTSAEAAALHFRGAFQNPFMYAPVVLPPMAAGALTAAFFGCGPRMRRTAGAFLRLTALLGVAGTAFHAWGVHRRMGGWQNWTQNVLAGPPLPAPPAFTGLALAGLAALELLGRDRRR
jgi:hypothetical protein